MSKGLVDRMLDSLLKPFEQAGFLLDKIAFTEEDVNSIKMQEMFDTLNHFAAQNNLPMSVEEKGQGIDGLPQTTMRALIVVYWGEGKGTDRRIAVDIDMTAEVKVTRDLDALRDKFIAEAKSIKPEVFAGNDSLRPSVK